MVRLCPGPCQAVISFCCYMRCPSKALQHLLDGAREGRSTLHSDRSERRREVVLERQAPGEYTVLEQRVLHRAEHGHVDAAVLREQRARELVGGQDRLRVPPHRLRRDGGRFGGVLRHEGERLEDTAERLPDVVGTL